MEGLTPKDKPSNIKTEALEPKKILVPELEDNKSQDLKIG